MSIRIPRTKVQSRPAIAPSLRVPKAFLDLAENDPAVLNRLVRGIERIIRNSFVVDPVRGAITANMVRERFTICEKWFRALRADRWGVGRILDNLGEALHSELNNKSWQPDTRRCWMPSDG